MAEEVIEREEQVDTHGDDYRSATEGMAHELLAMSGQGPEQAEDTEQTADNTAEGAGQPDQEGQPVKEEVGEMDTEAESVPSALDDFKKLPEELQKAALQAVYERAKGTAATGQARASDEPNVPTGAQAQGEEDQSGKDLQAEREELEVQLNEMEQEYGESLAKPLRKFLTKTFERAVTTEKIARAALALNDAQTKAATAQGKRVLMVEARSANPDLTPKQLQLVERMVDRGVVETEAGENPYAKAIDELRAAGAIGPAQKKPRPRATDDQRTLASRRSSGVAAETEPSTFETLDKDSLAQAIKEGNPMFSGLVTE